MNPLGGRSTPKRPPIKLPNRKKNTTEETKEYQSTLDEFFISKRRKLSTSKKELNILQWNAASFSSEKQREVLELSKKLNIQVICISELSARRVWGSIRLPTLPGFQLASLVRPINTKGIAIYVQNDIVWQEKQPIVSDKDTGILHQRILIFTKTQIPIQVDHVYLHPNSTKSSRMEVFQRIVSNQQEFHIIVGDFNEAVLHAGTATHPQQYTQLYSTTTVQTQHHG